MNVAKGNAKVLLDFLGREWKDIDDAVLESRCELIGNAQQMIHVSRLFIFPFFAAGQFVRNPLDEKRRVMPPAIILKGAIGLGVDVPLNRRKLRQLTSADFFK